MQALAAAFAPDARARFVFDGSPRAGRNAGALDVIDIGIDHQIVKRVPADLCRREMLVDARLDLTGLAAGSHTLTVTAYDARDHRRGGATVNTTFTLDPTLAPAEADRVEAHATPAPFACFKTSDGDDDEDHEGPLPSHPQVNGRFVPGGQSDGIDLARDRVVLAAGGRTLAIEPGMFTCDRSGDTCRYEAPRGNGFLRRLVLDQRRHGEWRFQIFGGPAWPRDGMLSLRVGNDWGALDLVTGERIARLRPALDASRAGQATIGTAGGTVQSTDAAGVVTQLIVPPGALTRDTLITATPLAAPPLVGQAAGLHLGTKFEPEGLVFAVPATLVLDFAGAPRSPAVGDAIYLLTSPMTRTPLLDNANDGTRLTASLSHFSTVQGDGLAPIFDNIVDWDPRLDGTGALTFTELKRLAEDLRVQLAMGCTPGPDCDAVDAAYANLVTQTQNSIGSLLASCGGDVLAPTRAAFDHWKTVLALAQGLGLDTTSVLDCVRNVLGALVDKVAADGLAHPADAAVDALDELERQAQSLGFSTIAARAHTKKHDVLQAVIDQAGTTAASDPSTANLQRMLGLKARAQALTFADLERRVLVQSVPAARAAISRLQSACAANASAPATDVAKELARTWVAFVNQDATVAPTLASDLRAAIDSCGGTLATVYGGDQGWLRTAINGITSGVGGFFTELLEPANLPFHMHYEEYGGIQDMRLSGAGNVVGMDLDIDAAPSDPSVDTTYATATLDFNFPRNGTLTMAINHNWLTAFATDYPQYGVLAFVQQPTEPVSIHATPLMTNCLAETCTSMRPQPAPGAASVVTIPVTAGSLRLQLGVQVYASKGTTAHGRVITLTYTPR